MSEPPLIRRHSYIDAPPGKIYFQSVELFDYHILFKSNLTLFLNLFKNFFLFDLFQVNSLLFSNNADALKMNDVALKI